MTESIIPYQFPDIDLPTENADFHSKGFSENRGAVLSELRYISGIAEIASTLNQDTIYKLVDSNNQAIDAPFSLIINGGL